MRYAIDSRKLQKELGWEPSLQFEEGIEETVKWYLENQEWMDNVTSGDCRSIMCIQTDSFWVRVRTVYSRGENSARLVVYGKGENRLVVCPCHRYDFPQGKIAETYNIGGFNEWKNIDIIKVVIKTVDRLLGRKEGEDLDLITYVTDRKGHDMRYAIDSRKLQKELGWEPSLQFEEGIEETVKWYLENQEWMDNVTSGDYQKYYDNMYSNR